MAAEGVKRRLSAILNADVAGYAKLMEEDEATTVRTMESYRKTVISLIEQHNGTVIDSPGDNILSEFASVVDAVQCAVEIQHVIKAKNAVVPDARRMQFRIGISLEDIIEEEDRIYGDGVNIASRVEKLADAGGICISGRAYDHIANKLPLGYEDIGEHTVKNISVPVQVYRIPIDSAAVVGLGIKKRGLKRYQWVALAFLAAIIVSVASVTVWNQYLKSPPPVEVVKPGTETVPIQTAKPAAAEKPSIAVLPFDNMSGDPEQEYFSDGMTEEIISRLSKNSGLIVIARNSTFAYKGKGVNIRQIADALGANYVLEGSVRKAGDNIRITAQFVDATTEGHLWAKTYDRDYSIDSLLDIQDQIAQQIAAALLVRYTEEEMKRARRMSTDDLTAYDYVLQGRYYHQQYTKESNARARELFEKAIELDPDYADAYAFLGDATGAQSGWGWSKDRSSIRQRTYELAQKAIALDEENRLAYLLLAELEQEPEKAIGMFRMAIKRDPNNPETYRHLGWRALWTGKWEEAIKAFETAILLNPKPTKDCFVGLSWIYAAMGRYEEAIEASREGSLRYPDYWEPHIDIAYRYIALWLTQLSSDPSLLDRSLSMAKRGLELMETVSDIHSAGALSLTHLYRKEYELAIEEAEKLIALDPERAAGYSMLASALNAIGRSAESVEIMKDSTSRHSQGWGAWFRGCVFGDSYRLSGHQAEAIKAYRAVVEYYPPHSDAYRARIGLAILYAELDQIEEAKAEADEILKLVPHFSVDVYGERVPYKDPAQAERDMAALRKAGLK